VWTLYWSSGRDGKNIASSIKGVFEGYPRLSLDDSSDGQFDLVINPTLLEDADIYGCSESFVFTSAELVLLGKCFVSVCY